MAFVVKFGFANSLPLAVMPLPMAALRDGLVIMIKTLCVAIIALPAILVGALLVFATMYTLAKLLGFHD